MMKKHKILSVIMGLIILTLVGCGELTETKPAEDVVENPQGSTTNSDVEIPISTVDYTVKAGDTFYGIAKGYEGTSAENIMEFNNLEANQIRAGMTIKIPIYK